MQSNLYDIYLPLLFPLQCDLPGFFDPSLGDDKILRIEYTFEDVLKTVNLKDNEPLRLPG